MTTSTAPLTREDLRQELDRVLVHYATKADLAELKADLNKTLIQMTIGLAGLQLIGLGAVAAILRFLGSG